MNPWLFGGICVGLFLLLWVVSARKWKQQAEALAARRANLTREEFIALLSDDAGADIAEFLWHELASYWTHGLTPHPGDDFLKDLPIDDEEPQDWLERYCGANGYDWKQWPQWDESHPTTVRNFARWLSEGRPTADNAWLGAG